MLSGHYINLSKDSERRARLDANLGELGLLSHIKRFEAKPSAKNIEVAAVRTKR